MCCTLRFVTFPLPETMGPFTGGQGGMESLFGSQNMAADGQSQYSVVKTSLYRSVPWGFCNPIIFTLKTQIRPRGGVTQMVGEQGYQRFPL